MGWDIHFLNTKRIEDILKDEDFKVEESRDGFVFMYVIDENTGKKSGLNVQVEEYLNYGYLPYGYDLGLFLTMLYRKFGILSAESIELQNLYHLYGYCLNDEELNALATNDYAISSLSMLDLTKQERKELDDLVKRTSAVVDELYERYKEANPQPIIKKDEKTISAEIIELGKEGEELPF